MALRRQASGLFGKAFARLTGGAASEAVATCSKLTAASFSHLLSEGGSRRLLQTSAPLMDNLSAILKDELKHEKENYTKPEVIASGPPAPFKLQVRCLGRELACGVMASLATGAPARGVARHQLRPVSGAEMQPR